MTARPSIPWNSIAAESIAIVVSILLAFTIDAWWEERKERRFEQEALASLQSEYEGHRLSIKRQIEFHDDSMRAIAAMMAACQDGEFEITGFTIDDALYFFRVPVTTDLGTGVRDAIISAGRIEVLGDRELRYELAAWDSVLLEVTDNQVFSSDYVRETVLPYLTRMGIPASGVMDQREGRPWPVPARWLADEPETTARLFGDPEFCSMLETRYGLMDHTRSEYDELLEAIERILDRIGRSMDNGR